MKKLLLRVNDDYLYDDVSSASVRYGKSINEYINLCLEYCNQNQAGLSNYLVMKIKRATDEVVTSLDSNSRASLGESFPYTGKNHPQKNKF